KFEHTDTEIVVGLDLVKLQLGIAAGEALPFSQADLRQRGHAIECRVYAEDPAAGFLPSTGTLLRVVEPGGPGVRVDSGFGTGDVVTHFYDPLLAKLVVWGVTRQQAIGTLQRALRDYAVLGVTTNLQFLQAVVSHPVFQAGEVTTAFVDRTLSDWSPPTTPPDMALIAAALADHLAPVQAATNPAVASDSDPYNPWRDGRFHREER
ncbi:MAG: acetyl-CoA carboxylase biotin carboxylase subunit, partial [Anaerolineae bacterium]|nr:acetyl-CoA carboxylase biotin carboxylase subunit [Anaerolineae bacterium]